MTEEIDVTPEKPDSEDRKPNKRKPEERNPWVRGLFMVLVMVAIHLCGTVLFIVTVIQFILMQLSDVPNARLTSFGRSLGRYLQQGANFLTYGTEEMPFPFSDWPSGD